MQVSYFVLYVSLPCLVGLAAEINKSNQIKSNHVTIRCLRFAPWWHQGCGIGAGFVRSRSFLGGVGFLTTLGVVYFVRPRMSKWIIFLHHTPKLGIPVEMVQFLLKLLLK